MFDMIRIRYKNKNLVCLALPGGFSPPQLAKKIMRRNLRELASLVSGVVGEETPAKKHTQSGALL